MFLIGLVLIAGSEPAQDQVAQVWQPEVHLSDLQRQVGQPEEHLRAHEEDSQRLESLQVLRLQAPGEAYDDAIEAIVSLMSSGG